MTSYFVGTTYCLVVMRLKNDRKTVLRPFLGSVVITLFTGIYFMEIVKNAKFAGELP